MIYLDITNTTLKRKQDTMATRAPLIRSEAQELQRQISFAKTLRERVYKKAEEKASEYSQKIETLEAKLAELEV